MNGPNAVGKSHLVMREVSRQCADHFGEVLPVTGELLQQLDAVSSEFVPHLRPPVLLLLDDVPGPESLPDSLLNSGAQLVVVSRAAADSWRHLAKVVTVGPFAREESVRFLTSNLTGLSRGEADRLAEHLGDLPLALTCLLHWYVPGVTAEVLLHQVKNHAPVMFGAGKPDDYHSSLVTEMRRAMDALPPDDLLSHGDVLGALALMDGVSFPISLLNTQPHRRRWRSALNELPSERRVPLYRFDAMLRDLEQREFVRVVKGEVHVVWLTCQLVRHAMSSAEFERAMRVAESMLLGTVPASRGVARWEDWPCWEASVDALQSIDPKFLTTSPGRYALLAACDFLVEQGRAAEARDRLLALRSDWKRTRDVPWDLRLRAVDLLSQASWRLGDTARARRYGATAFRVRRFVQGPHHPDTIASAARWALAACRIDRLEELRPLAEAIPDQRLAFRISAFIALLRERSFHGPGLVEWIEKIAKAQSDLLGPGHPHTLVTTHLLAQALSRAGEPTKACEQYEETLAFRTKTLGPRHPDTIATARALRAQRRELRS
ncbi:tetratricopeptide repeat protein [Streptomyces sp. GMY02]|uniref:tetratricopeptide repeat protein n=1 Tax=Streptomyces sp. GMY02 TaxID=1333528 RepID=UPI001C2C27C7|nr:tetratricopeptide repeat protein [Streptomyces sp. GMY02]QXE35650.1 tetratricopeptide repeat protein [Streptomyces sp. GMY02]